VPPLRRHVTSQHSGSSRQAGRCGVAALEWHTREQVGKQQRGACAVWQAPRARRVVCGRARTAHSMRGVVVRNAVRGVVRSVGVVGVCAQW